jgi:hypothetical protein
VSSHCAPSLLLLTTLTAGAAAEDSPGRLPLLLPVLLQASNLIEAKKKEGAANNDTMSTDAGDATAKTSKAWSDPVGGFGAPRGQTAEWLVIYHSPPKGIYKVRGSDDEVRTYCNTRFVPNTRLSTPLSAHTYTPHIHTTTRTRHSHTPTQTHTNPDACTPVHEQGRAEFLRIMLEDAGADYQNTGPLVYGPHGPFDMFRGGAANVAATDDVPYPVVFPPALHHRPSLGKANKVRACVRACVLA